MKTTLLYLDTQNPMSTAKLQTKFILNLVNKINNIKFYDDSFLLKSY